MKYGRLVTVGLTSLLALVIGCNSMQTSSAILRYQQGEYEIAESLCVEALEINPQDGEAYFYMALSQSQLEEFRDAYENFKKAAELKPERAEAAEQNIKSNWTKVYNEGISYTNDENYEMAVEFFEQATQADPEEPKAYSNLARTYLIQAEKYKKIDPITYEDLMKDGLAKLELALELETEPESQEETAKLLCTVLGNLYIIPGQEDEEREPYLTRYREVTRELPGFFSVHEAFGYILYEEAVSKKTNSFYPFAGQALARAAELREEAYAKAEAAGDIEGMDAALSVETPMYAGMAYMAAEMFEEGSKNFEKALALNPNDSQMWYFKEYCDYKNGDYESAISAARTLEDTFKSTDPEVFKILAFCYKDMAVAADDAGEKQKFQEYRNSYEDAYRSYATYKGLPDDTPPLLLSKTEQAEQARRENALFEKDNIAVISAQIQGRFVRGVLLNKGEDTVDFMEMSIDLLDQSGEVIDTAYAEFEQVQGGKEVNFSAFFVAEPEDVAGFEVTDIIIE